MRDTLRLFTMEAACRMPDVLESACGAVFEPEGFAGPGRGSPRSLPGQERLPAIVRGRSERPVCQGTMFRCKLRQVPEIAIAGREPLLARGHGGRGAGQKPPLAGSVIPGAANTAEWSPPVGDPPALAAASVYWAKSEVLRQRRRSLAPRAWTGFVVLSVLEQQVRGEDRLRVRPILLLSPDGVTGSLEILSDRKPQARLVQVSLVRTRALTIQSPKGG